MQIIRINELIDKTKMSRTTIWRLYKFSDFPKPIQLSQRSVGFDLDLVDIWLSNRPHKN
ncbi:MAG: AlpA family phage regulatory protein [Pseudomonadota bacterium]